MQEIDLEGLTADDLENLKARVYQAIQLAERHRAAYVTEKKASVARVIKSLEDLLGDPDAPAYDPSDPEVTPTILSVNKHSEEVFSQNAGLALKLILSGMEILTRTMRDLAIITSSR